MAILNSTIVGGKLTVNGAISQNGALLSDTYAAKSHTHSQYLTSHQDISGKVNKTGDTMSGLLYINRAGDKVPSLKWNKDGTYYGGVGHNSASNVNFFGPVKADGTWANDSSKDIWYFQGTIQQNGTNVALISDIPSIPTSLPANGGNADTVDNVHMEWNGSQAASDTEWLAGWTADGTKIKAVKRADLNVNYCTSAGSVAWGNVSDKPNVAVQERENNLVHAGNEITMVPSGFSGALYYNYRTAGGMNGNITEYILGNGKGGSLGAAIHTGNLKAQMADKSDTVVGNCTYSFADTWWNIAYKIDYVNKVVELSGTVWMDGSSSTSPGAIGTPGGVMSAIGLRSGYSPQSTTFRCPARLGGGNGGYEDYGGMLLFCVPDGWIGAGRDYNKAGWQWGTWNRVNNKGVTIFSGLYIKLN